MDRAHRLGQTKPVHVTKLIMKRPQSAGEGKDSVEQRVLELQVCWQSCTLAWHHLELCCLYTSILRHHSGHASKLLCLQYSACFCNVRVTRLMRVLLGNNQKI